MKIFSLNLRMWSGSLVMLSMICRRPEQPSNPATSSGWQIRSWQRWTRPILWAHLFMWHFTKAIWLTRPFEQLHLLLLFRSITGFIPTHMVIRLLEFEIRFDLTTYVKNSEVRILRVSYLLIRLFDFNIFLFALLTRVSLWGTIKKTNKSELWNRLSYRRLPYLF